MRRTDGYAARRGQSNTVEIGNGIGNELDGDRGLARFEVEHTEFDLRIVEARAERAAPPDHACGYFKRSDLAVVRNGYLVQLVGVDPRIAAAGAVAIFAVDKYREYGRHVRIGVYRPSEHVVLGDAVDPTLAIGYRRYVLGLLRSRAVEHDGLQTLDGFRQSHVRLDDNAVEVAAYTFANYLVETRGERNIGYDRIGIVMPLVARRACGNIDGRHVDRYAVDSKLGNSARKLTGIVVCDPDRQLGRDHVGQSVNSERYRIVLGVGVAYASAARRDGYILFDVAVTAQAVLRLERVKTHDRSRRVVGNDPIVGHDRSYGFGRIKTYAVKIGYARLFELDGYGRLARLEIEQAETRFEVVIALMRAIAFLRAVRELEPAHERRRFSVVRYGEIVKICRVRERLSIQRAVSEVIGTVIHIE